MQYGRPDSEINGRLIAKERKKGGETIKIYGFSVLDGVVSICAERQVLVRSNLPQAGIFNVVLQNKCDKI